MFHRPTFRFTSLAIFFAFLLAISVSGVTLAEQPPSEPPADWGPISSTFEEVPYPHPVHYLDLHIFGKDMRMAYMDVAPKGKPNGQTVMLFHGMNFSGLAFTPTIEALTEAGFRVIAPDRIGYGRSSKPVIPYNLHVFASNAKALLDHLGIEKVAIVGHSMGGALASRFAMTYDDITTHVVMVNQIGMTDSRPKRPWTDIEDIYQSTLKGTTYQSILRNHMLYYPTWDNKYLYWVKLQYGQTLTGEWPKLARIRAWQRLLMYFDTVVYDWQHIDTKAMVIGGAADRLSGDYPTLARNVAESLPNAELVLFEGVGHNPHFQIPEKYHAELIRFLRSDPDEPASSEWKNL